MASGRIFDIKRFSVHDGPGIRTTVFLQGCPLSCAWCHNPESRPSVPVPAFHPERCLACGLCAAACPEEDGPTPSEPWPAACGRCGRCVSVCPADARQLVGREVDAGALLDEVDHDRLHFEESGGGVTFSGGEPLAQPGFLLSLLAGCRDRGLHTAIDTTGHADMETVAAAAELVDLWLFDLKHPEPAEHRALTAVDNAVILRNLELLARQERSIWLRVPVVPGLTDRPEALARTGRLARDLGIARLHLLPYHAAAGAKQGRFARDTGVPDLQPPTTAHLARLADGLRALGLDVQVGG